MNMARQTLMRAVWSRTRPQVWGVYEVFAVQQAGLATSVLTISTPSTPVFGVEPTGVAKLQVIMH